jgi:hypothetical protein
MTDSIIPPPELVQQWHEEWCNTDKSEIYDEWLATCAAQWAADQELEACLANIHTMYGKDKADWVRAMRRPKPPSLKEQALLQLDTLNADLAMHGRGCDLSQIRRAL